MTVSQFWRLGGEHLALLFEVLQIQYKEATVTGLASLAVSVMAATPLKLNPRFLSSSIFRNLPC